MLELLIRLIKPKYIHILNNQLNTYLTHREARFDVQKKSNPVVVPRNHILQRAIDRAELGDNSLARR